MLLRAWRWGLVVAVLLVAVPTDAQRRHRYEFRSGGVSQYGGQPLPAHKNALAAGGLYPSGFFQFTIGMARAFDLGLRGDVYYASPLSSDPFGWGLGFSVPMRVGLSRSDKVAFALRLAPDFVMGKFEDDDFGNRYCHCHNTGRGSDCHCHDDRDDFDDDFDDDDFGIGPGFEFGLLVGIPVSIVNVVAGITSPMHIVFFEDHDGADVFFPIAPFGGAEIRLGPRLNVFGIVQGGVTIHTNEFDTDQEGFFRFWAGIEYAM